MDLSSLRSLVHAINFASHGVQAIVTRPYPDDAPIQTDIIWAQPTTEALSRGFEIQRQEAREVVALSRSDVPTVPRGTIIVAPGPFGGPTGRWRVEGPERIERDHVRVVVVSDPVPY